MPPAVAVPDFQTLFEHAPNAYILVRTNAPEWTIAAVSDAYLAATHRRREEILGRGTFDVFPESAETQRSGGAQSIRASFEQAMATGAPNELPVLRYDVAREDGPYEPRYWQLSNYPVFDENKRVAFILHQIDELAPEIAEAKTLRRKLEQTNEKLEAANAELQASARLMHLNAERERAKSAERAAIEIDNARLLRDAQEARVLAERAQASAISANKAKSDFLATMSHEIRTPINAILGYEELLELELSGPLTVDQRAQLTRIRSSARHLLGLVNEVLDLAKIESGVLHVTPTQASAGTTVDAALSLIRPQAKARGITVSSQCEGARDAVYLGDEARVRQVLINLLSNAVKFTEPGGTIAVACVRHDPTAELRLAGGRSYVGFQVTDSGIGISPDEIDRIFEPFTQVMQDGQTPYTRENSGTGLGLSISRQLAHLMGGEITVTSFPGRGSTFTFWVPTPPKADVFSQGATS